MCKKFLFVLLGFLLLPLSSLADHFETNANYTVCFTPGTDCTAQIVASIDGAVSNIWVQAYSFTSRPISKALVTAKERGVNVQIIFDKSGLDYKKGAISYFARHGIPVTIDNLPAIAHNKVMIIDQTKVVTGSFNFTRAAQEKNAENVLIIEDKGLAQKYLKNWQSRQQVSTAYANNENFEQKHGNILQELWDAFLNWLQKWFGIAVPGH